LRDANGPLSRVIAYKSLRADSYRNAERKINDGYDIERIGGKRETANSQKKKKKKGNNAQKKLHGSGQTMWSYPAENFRGSQLWTYVEEPLLLSRLAKAPRASRSAICQTRLKICAVGSLVIIAEAYR